METKKNYKIALIIPYFGKWPGYLNLYLESCKSNSFIDILFVTDLPPINPAPSNIKFISLTFDQLKSRIEKEFHLHLSSMKPYKLCDFRPAYGLIFKQELEKYDFWGYGDNDLVYGNLKSFLSTEVLGQYDIIAFRDDHLHGPFTLYRNTEIINRLFERSELIKNIFSDLMYLSFDEFGRESFHTSQKSDLSEYSNDNISIIALRAASEGIVKLYMKALSKEVIHHTKEIIVYENGSVFNYKTNQQYAFYHWVLEKRALWFKYPNWKKIPGRYYISETGFYTTTQFKFYSLIHFMRKLTGTIYWMFLKGMNYLKRKSGFKVTLDTYPKIGFVKSL